MLQSAAPERDGDPDSPVAGIEIDRSVDRGLLVLEANCSSGRPVTGRTEVSVRYSDSAVTIDIRVRPLGDDQTCEASETPFSVQLREPLGKRELVDANTRTP